MKGTDIQSVKRMVNLQKWAAEVKACQESGLTVSRWCEENGVKLKSYYNHLRRVREAAIDLNSIDCTYEDQSVVGIGKIPVPKDKIEISNGRIKITLPSDVMPELLLTAIGGLNNVS